MFSRPYRLSAQAAKLVARRGNGLSGPFLRIKWGLSRNPVSRATVVAGLAFDKRAIRRNLIKRRVREVLRPILPKLRPAVNLMVFVNKAATGCTFQELGAELISLLKRARII